MSTDQKEIQKLVKSIQSDFKKYSESLDLLYDLTKNKNIYDLSAYVVANRHQVNDLSNLV